MKGDATPSSPVVSGSGPRNRFALWALLYAIALVYVSTVLGPLGFNFVSISLSEAWQAMLSMPYLIHGSDQRADWMSNLLMLVPLGFLITGSTWPRRDHEKRSISALGSLLICLVFVLVIKFAQLFFSPRTVSINYVVAQSLGVLAGIYLFWLSHGTLARTAGTILKSDRDALRAALTLYVIALFFFYLFPFDFILNLSDLHSRASELPRLMLSVPGEGRRIIQRLALISAETAAAVPLGMWLAIWKHPSRPAVFWAGIAIGVGITFIDIFILSAAPSLVSTVCRIFGIGIGITSVLMIERYGLEGLRRRLTRALPVIIPLYIFAVLLVNDVATGEWRTVGEANADFDHRGLLPFWNFYIVGKTQALESLVVHAVTYAPIGIMVWLRRGPTANDAWLAAALALGLSLLVEVGRSLKPGLEGDFSDPIIAAIAAALAARAAPRAWAIINSLNVKEPSSPISQQQRR